MVPVERIELPTFGLQNRCSTAELQGHGGALTIFAAAVKWSRPRGYVTSHVIGLELRAACDSRPVARMPQAVTIIIGP